MVGSKEDRSINVMMSIKKTQSIKQKVKTLRSRGEVVPKMAYPGGGAPSERVFFFRLEGKERVGISLV